MSCGPLVVLRNSTTAERPPPHPSQPDGGSEDERGEERDAELPQPHRPSRRRGLGGAASGVVGLGCDLGGGAGVQIQGAYGLVQVGLLSAAQADYGEGVLIVFGAGAFRSGTVLCHESPSSCTYPPWLVPGERQVPVAQTVASKLRARARARARARRQRTRGRAFGPCPAGPRVCLARVRTPDGRWPVGSGGWAAYAGGMHGCDAGRGGSGSVAHTVSRSSHQPAVSGVMSKVAVAPRSVATWSS